MVRVQRCNGGGHREHCNEQVLGKLNVVQKEIRQPLLYRLESAESRRGMGKVLLVDIVLLLAEFQIALQRFTNGFRIGR